jgi:hypothetical protein
MEDMKLEVVRQKETLKAVEIINDLREDNFNDYETLSSLAVALFMEAFNQEFTKENFMSAVEETWDTMLDNIKKNASDGKPLH